MLHGKKLLRHYFILLKRLDSLFRAEEVPRGPRPGRPGHVDERFQQLPRPAPRARRRRAAGLLVRRRLGLRDGQVRPGRDHRAGRHF